MISFHAGELFKSFADLQRKLADFSEENYCHFYIKDSKKLSPDEIINPHLIYKHVVYSCIYGGQKPRFRGTGSRSVTSIRHGCTAALYLRVTKDRTHLQVRNFNEEHNHEISEELFRSAAQDKKLPYDLRTEIEELLLLGADKDRLCEYIRYVTHKNLDKKNLFNIYDSAIKTQREITRERAIILIQKAYGVDTDEEADQILQQLLLATKPARRPKKHSVEVMENVQVAYYNENDDSQGEADGEEGVDQSLQRLMGTLSGHDGERIVIVQQNDDDYEVIEADNALEVSEYLEEEDGAVMVKQEVEKEDTGSRETSNTRYLTIQDLTRANSRKRPLPKTQVARKAVNSNYHHNSEDTIIYQEEPPSKTRLVEGDMVLESEGLQEARLEIMRAENEKLVAETEMLKLKRNKLVRDMSKLDAEKNKIHLEIELIRQRKNYIETKSTWLQTDLESKALKSEKLRLEIANLKVRNEN